VQGRAEPQRLLLHLALAPNAEPNELRFAVRWKIKGLLDIKIDDAAIDVFQVLEDKCRARQMFYTVASLKPKVQFIAEIFSACGLELEP